MTPEQFDRWRDFATRMARTCFPRRRRPNAAWIEEMVLRFIDYNISEGERVCIRSWDHSDPYPEGHRDFRMQYGRPVAPMGVSSVMGEWMWSTVQYELIPEMPRRLHARYRRAIDRGDIEAEDAILDGWVEERWMGPVKCCVRAGLDMACEPSAGVMGFTAGDLRRMYPEGVPEWVFPPEERLRVEHLKTHPLGYTRASEPTLNGTFAELPDDAEVWL